MGILASALSYLLGPGLVAVLSSTRRPSRCVVWLTTINWLITSCGAIYPFPYILRLLTLHELFKNSENPPATRETKSFGQLWPLFAGKNILLLCGGNIPATAKTWLVALHTLWVSLHTKSWERKNPSTLLLRLLIEERLVEQSSFWGTFDFRFLCFVCSPKTHALYTSYVIKLHLYSSRELYALYEFHTAGGLIELIIALQGLVV